MFKMLNDTCVWMDVAKDPQQQVMLEVMKELLEEGQLTILAPRMVIDEFNRNKGKITEHNTRSISGVLKRVKEIVRNFGDEGAKEAALQQLHKVDQKLPQLGDTVAGSVRLVEYLLSKAVVIETTESLKLRAAERALQNKAPFHRSKNSMGDALIIETFADCTTGTASAGHRFAFVTHNVKDFSEPDGNQKNPHPDFAPLFSKRKVRYFITLAEALNAIRPDIVSEYQFDELGQHRTTDEILKGIEELTDRVWHNRHLVRVEKHLSGEERMAPEVWAGACRSAKKVERKYGRENLGPYDDFDWGMINGKLSALRWVLGEDWDELYT